MGKYFQEANLLVLRRDQRHGFRSGPPTGSHGVPDRGRNKSHDRDDSHPISSSNVREGRLCERWLKGQSKSNQRTDQDGEQ
jgi:hypothetical protein